MKPNNTTQHGLSGRTAHVTLTVIMILTIPAAEAIIIITIRVLPVCLSVQRDRGKVLWPGSSRILGRAMKKKKQK